LDWTPCKKAPRRDEGVMTEMSSGQLEEEARSLLNEIMKAKEMRAGGIWDSKVNRMSLAIVYPSALIIYAEMESLLGQC
jgi:hypothetical protein